MIFVEADFGAAGAGDAEAGVFLLEDFAGFFRSAFCAAEEVNAPLVFGGAGSEGPDEAGTGDALRNGVPADLAGPDEGHAIGEEHISAALVGVEEGAEGSVEAVVAEDVEVGGEDPGADAGVDAGFEDVEGLFLSDGVERHAQELAAAVGDAGESRASG